MGDSTGGDPSSLSLAFERARVEGSRKNYNSLVFQSRRLNSLLKDALKEKDVSRDWIKKASMIRMEDCTRGFHRATDVLIYNRDDFREITFGLNDQLDIEKYMKGVTALVDPHQLEVRPSVCPPDVGKVKQSIDVLSEGYWGWYSERQVPVGREIMGKKDPLAEVWKYEPSISTSDGMSYLAFYTKSGAWLKGARKMADKVLGFGFGDASVTLGWVYFPVEEQYAEALQSLFQDSIAELKPNKK